MNRTPLVFPRRPRRLESVALGLTLCWFSKCGIYRVIRCPEFESGVKQFRATVLCPITGHWLRVEPARDVRHRRLRGATSACQKHFRGQLQRRPRPTRLGAGV